MIGQRIGLTVLIPLALAHLENDPLAEADFYPGDLLTNVLRIELSFWSAYPRLGQRLATVLDRLPSDLDEELIPEIVNELMERATTFREHTAQQPGVRLRP
jgi:hypothetical protein